MPKFTPEEKLFRFVAVRPRSEKEIRDWFRRRKIPEDLHLSLFDRLKSLDLLDDRKFAAWWVEQRIQFRSKSKKEIEYELRNKGIDKEIITEALAGSGIDELKSAKKLLERYASRTRQQKIDYLARKGFAWEVIDRLVSKE